MKIVISGAGEVGTHLAKMLSAASNDITVIDDSEERLQSLSSSVDTVVVEGSPSSMDTLKKAGVPDADLFIAVYPDNSQAVNIVSALLAKKMGSRKVTARVNDEEYLSYENKYLFTEMGIDLMFYPEKIASEEILGMLRRNSATDSLDFARGRLQLAVFKLSDESPLLDTTLREFDQCTGSSLQFRVVAVSRGSETFIPKPDMRFRSRDQLFIITKQESLDVLKRHIGKNDAPINRVMIIGGSPIAVMVARTIAAEGMSVKLIERDREKCLELSERLPDSVMIINGDGRNSDLLVDEGISSYDAFLALTGDSETNILTCVEAKRTGVGMTVAQVENLEYISLAESIGVDSVINKKLITAGRIFRFTLSTKVRFIKYISGINAELAEFIVAKNARITKGTLSELAFPENAVIGGVIRGNDSFIAVGSTRIQEYDRVAVFAMPDAVREVDKWFN